MCVVMLDVLSFLGLEWVWFWDGAFIMVSDLCV